MAKKATLKSPVRRGSSAIPKEGGTNGSPFVRIKPDERVDIVSMVDMIDLVSIDQHAIWLDSGNSPIFPCISVTDEPCPGCQLGNRAKFAGFLPVLTLSDEGHVEPKLYVFGIQVARQLSELDETIDGIAGTKIRIKREGSGMSTKYTLTNTGKRYEFDGEEAIDPEEHLGPITRRDILKLLVESKVDVDGILLKEEYEEFGVAPMMYSKDVTEDLWDEVIEED